MQNIQNFWTRLCQAILTELPYQRERKKAIRTSIMLDIDYESMGIRYEHAMKKAKGQGDHRNAIIYGRIANYFHNESEKYETR